MLVLKFLVTEINEVFLGTNSECVNFLIDFTVNQRLTGKSQGQ